MTWEFEEVIIEKNPNLELIINNESWRVIILNFSKRNPCYQICLRQKTLYINYVSIKHYYLIYCLH